MKKLTISIITLFFVANMSFAVDKSKVLEVKIIENIIKGIKNKNTVCFFNIDEETKKVFTFSEKLKISKKCEKADIMLIKELEKPKNFKKPAFALDYISFKNCLNCIGGFFWRKGRPQIVLIKENLDKFNLKINKEFQKFIISKEILGK